MSFLSQMYSMIRDVVLPFSAFCILSIGGSFFLRLRVDYCTDVVCHFEMYVLIHEADPVNLFWVVVITRSRVKFQCLAQCFQLLCAENGCYIIGDNHPQPVDVIGIRKTGTCFQVCVRVGQVGLDVIYRCAVHDVCTADMEYCALCGVVFHRQQPDR